MTSPTPGPLRTPRISAYTTWLQRERGRQFAHYDALWEWSVTDLEGFWQSIWDHFELQSPTPHECVLAQGDMPGARWFPGAQVNLARQVLRHGPAAHAAGHPAIVFADEPMLARGELQELSWPQLHRQVACLAAALRGMGVRRGDRVAAVLPNTPQTAAAFLAVASLGAVWSICSPEMGPVAVLDRFRQIEPKVLLAVDHCRWGGVVHDRRAHVDTLLAALPSVSHAVRGAELDALLAHGPDPGTDFEAGFAPEWLPFDHPLWIVYSSGTTGLPKPIVHGHGGILLETCKASLHNDLGPTAWTGDRFHWYSTTGWIMWNCQVLGLAAGTTCCIFDGSAAGPAGAPDWSTLWRFAGLARVTFFGAGAAFYASCMKADIHPMAVAELSCLRAIGSTGSPLSEACHDWIWQRCPQVDGEPIWIDAISGGTDFAGAFVGGNVTLPQVRGQMQCRWLGAAVQAWDDHGRPVTDTVGELVCTRPLPSMPLRFWNDPDGRRYRESYFDMFPGVWRHGDWIRIVPPGQPALGGGASGASGAVIYGRSDATINRQGVRMGTAELYRVVEERPEVVDSLVVDLEYLGRESWMPLFVVLREGVVLDEALRGRLQAAIRAGLGPRHVPSEIFQVAAIPRTLSGKKMELPVKRLLLGVEPERVLNRDAMANADSLPWFLALARQRAGGAPPP
jgi:acetoacetyl-CoA synthetase